MSMGEHRATGDGLTEEQVDNAFEVLEVIRENMYENDMDGEAELLNNAHCIVQQYDQFADWHTVQDDME